MFDRIVSLKDLSPVEKERRYTRSEVERAVMREREACAMVAMNDCEISCLCSDDIRARPKPDVDALLKES